MEHRMGTRGRQSHIRGTNIITIFIKIPAVKWLRGNNAYTKLCNFLGVLFILCLNYGSLWVILPCCGLLRLLVTRCGLLHSLVQPVVKNSAIYIGKNLSWSLLLTKLFQHRCFPVNIVNFLRTSILRNICERLLLHVVINSNEEQHLLVKLDEIG